MVVITSIINRRKLLVQDEESNHVACLGRLPDTKRQCPTHQSQDQCPVLGCLHAGLELKGTTYKNYSKGEQSRTKLANPVKAEKLKGNIWEYVVGKKAVDQEAKKHPAPFPYDLALDHIRSWSNEGDVVLDPMCGSGTTCVAAKDSGRKYIGIDISKEYCQLAESRIKMHSNTEPSLFVNMGGFAVCHKC